MGSQFLSSTRKSVAEIAELCGFADQFYFSWVFKRHFGQPPLHYRKARFWTRAATRRCRVPADITNYPGSFGFFVIFASTAPSPRTNCAANMSRVPKTMNDLAGYSAQLFL